MQSPKRVFTSSGIYNPSVEITNRLGCQRTYTSSNVIVPVECFNGDIVATPTNATVCAGSSNGVLMTYQPSGSECGASYQWMNELAPVSGANGSSYTAYVPGVYWVKLSSPQNCTYSSPSRIAPVFRLPPAVQLSGATVYCANNVNRNITALTAAGNGISWTVNGQFYGTAPTINLGSLAVGVYNVTATVTDSFGCQNAAGTVVEIIPLPEPPAIEYSLNNCQPYKVDVFVANAGSGIYNWSNGMGGTANTLVNGGPLEIAYTEGGCTVRSQRDIPKDPEFYAWIFPSGCIAACDYKEGFGYLIGPRLPLHYWGWLQDNNIVSEGTDSFPEDTFWPTQNFIIKAFENEAIQFDEIFIDKSFPEDNASTRKPRTGMLTKYLDNPEYDLENSFVIGDRITDVELAKNLGSKAIFIKNEENLGGNEIATSLEELQNVISLQTNDWQKIYEFLKLQQRIASIKRTTNETDIVITLNLG